MATLSQQEALLELQAWLEAAYGRLQGCRSELTHSSSGSAAVTRLLRDCRVSPHGRRLIPGTTAFMSVVIIVLIRVPCQESQAEMAAHQGTLDYVNQLLPTCSTEEGHWRRYEHNQFAEQQGIVTYEWLRLQEALNSQVEP